MKNLRENAAIEIFRNDHWSIWARNLGAEVSVNKGKLTGKVGDYPREGF